jgi:hypothetical protein
LFSERPIAFDVIRRLKSACLMNSASQVLRAALVELHGELAARDPVRLGGDFLDGAGDRPGQVDADKEVSFREL